MSMYVRVGCPSELTFQGVELANVRLVITSRINHRNDPTVCHITG